MTNSFWGISPSWYQRLFYASLVVTTVLLLIDFPESDIPSIISDKQMHFIMFFGITLLGSRGLRHVYGLPMLAALAGYALLTEFLQWFVPWRSFSWADWLADIAGILSYHCLYLLKSYFVHTRS